MTPKPKPLVALVGRPNVGKSTLFNRIIGQRHAIVEDLPGTTRDRIYADAEWQGRSFLVVDTGGIEALAEKEQGQPMADPLATASVGFIREIREQAEAAISEADIILLLFDASEGLTSADEEIAELLRDTAKPVIVVANKADNEERRLNAVEFYSLGLGDPIAVSAYHGTGTGDLLDAMVEMLPSAPLIDDDDDEILRIAIVGRPNVGKSSLLNALLGHDRAIVSDIAGTTRDPVDTYMTWDGEPLILVDTAGIRRRGRIERGIEKYSVFRALRAVGRAEVALLVVDAVEGVTAQDAHIGGYVLEENRSLVLVVNKWDAIPKDSYTMVEYTRVLREELKFLDYVPILFVSALTRQRVNQILPTALRVRNERFQRIPTAELNKLLRDATVAHPPKSFRGKRVRFYYVTQAEADPPTFVFFVNDPTAVHFTYQRYLQNKIRERYRFEGTPIKLEFRGKPPKKERP